MNVGGDQNYFQLINAGKLITMIKRCIEFMHVSEIMSSDWETLSCKKKRERGEGTHTSPFPPLSLSFLLFSTN